MSVLIDLGLPRSRKSSFPYVLGFFMRKTPGPRAFCSALENIDFHNLVIAVVLTNQNRSKAMLKTSCDMQAFDSQHIMRFGQT